MNDVIDSKTTISDVKILVDQFICQRDWHKFHDAKNLSTSIAIEAAELMEHFQWLRNDELDTILNDGDAMAAIRDELADIFAYLLSFANRMNVDLSSALADKMKKNAAKYPVEQFRGRYR